MLVLLAAFGQYRKFCFAACLAYAASFQGFCDLRWDKNLEVASPKVESLSEAVKTLLDFGLANGAGSRPLTNSGHPAVWHERYHTNGCGAVDVQYSLRTFQAL